MDEHLRTIEAALQASGFVAKVRSQSGPDAGTDRWQPNELQVNDPLRMDGERLYLLGHGFSPHFQITYPDGTSPTNRREPLSPAYRTTTPVHSPFRETGAWGLCRIPCNAARP